MNITVNGVSREVSSPPLTPLLRVLREELGVTGTKVGCEAGGCGACSVLIDGEPRRSCLTPVGSLNGSEVTTVEGLGTADHLSPVQQAFVHYYAAQCGFCTPGMVVAATAYINKGGSSDAEEIEAALSGHMCRCTGYRKIIEAVAAVAGGQTEFDLGSTAIGANTTVKTGGR